MTLEVHDDIENAECAPDEEMHTSPLIMKQSLSALSNSTITF
jgi:hypothetical protein